MMLDQDAGGRGRSRGGQEAGDACRKARFMQLIHERDTMDIGRHTFEKLKHLFRADFCVYYFGLLHLIYLL